MSNAKSVLIVMRTSPYASMAAKEGLDVALMAAVFNQPTRILFMDEGVFQLVKQQAPVDIAQKNVSATLPLLEMYDVQEVLADEAALEKRGLTQDDLIMPVKIIDTEAIKQLLSEQTLLLNF